VKGGLKKIMKFNFKKISAIASSLLMTGMTMGIAAAASFPAPFDAGSTSANAVVYGASAASTDVAAVTNINQYLKDNGVSSEAGEPEGEFVSLEKTNTKVNIGDTVSSVFGLTVNDDDLPTLLGDGTYDNDENTQYDYTQKITLGSWELDHFADENNGDLPSLGMNLSGGTFVMNYTLDFTTSVESDVEGGDLVDLETTMINLFGKEYYISNVDNGTNVKMELLDTANSEMISEGETKTLNIGGNTYEVAISTLTTTQVRLIVNEELTNELSEGSSYHLGNDVYLGIKDIFQRDVSGVVGSVEFSIGSGKLEIENGQSIELNDEGVTEVVGYVHMGSETGGKAKLNKIVLSWTTEDNEYITTGSELVMPGFESIKLSFGDLVKEYEEVIEVDYSGKDEVTLSAPFKDGTKKFSILYANASGEFEGLGESATNKLVTSASASLTFNTSTDKYFVASYYTSNDAESYLLEVLSVEDPSSGSNRTDIKNVITDEVVCKDQEANDVCDIGGVSLTITTVYPTAGNSDSVVLNGASNVAFDELYTAQGLKIYLPVSVTNITGHGAKQGEIALDGNSGNTTAGYDWDSWYLFMHEEDKDAALGRGTEFKITLNDNTDHNVHVTAVTTGSANIDDPDSDDNTESYVHDELGTKVEKIVVSDKGMARITYFGEEVYAPIYLTSAGSAIGSSGSMIFKDSEKSSWQSRNAILVGGSCINSAVAEKLGGALCEGDFTAETGVDAGQFLIASYDGFADGKIALVVAGYSAADTAMAADTLISGSETIDTAVGMSYLGTTAASEGSVLAAM